MEDKLLLSPGSVTVIKPQEMKGEQKTLPELLKQVPGLHIIETKGRGAYTTASVRGSSSSQVSVYVDGVLMNLGSEAAVDLSTIPVENVERIEVYRGYIPARFGGASMGGVINIITGKPAGRGAGGPVTRSALGSFGRTHGPALSYSTPLGDGRVFVGLRQSRPGTDGDFDVPERQQYAIHSVGRLRCGERRITTHTRTPTPCVKWQNDSWTRSKEPGNATTVTCRTGLLALTNRGAHRGRPSSPTNGTSLPATAGR